MVIESIDRYKNGTRIFDKEKEKYVYYFKPCPHCNSGRLYFRDYYRSRDIPQIYAVTCSSCYVSTNWFDSKEKALDAPLFKGNI